MANLDPFRCSIVAALLIGTATLSVACASPTTEGGDGRVLTVLLPPGQLFAGGTATFAVRETDASTGSAVARALVSLAPYGQSALTSSSGWAFFDVHEDAVETVPATWSAQGANDVTVLLNWTTPRTTMVAPTSARTGEPIPLTLHLTWANGTAIPGASAGLVADGSLLDVRITDANGVALLTVPENEVTGSASYEIVYDEPWLHSAASSFVVEWSAPAHLPRPPPNHPPVALFSESGSLTPGAILTFDGRPSYDPDGTPVTFSWAFSDGATAGGPVVTHSFATAGTVSAALVVMDDKGVVDRTEHSLFLTAPTTIPARPPPSTTGAPPTEAPPTAPPASAPTTNQSTTDPGSPQGPTPADPSPSRMTVPAQNASPPVPTPIESSSAESKIPGAGPDSLTLNHAANNPEVLSQNGSEGTRRTPSPNVGLFVGGLALLAAVWPRKRSDG